MSRLLFWGLLLIHLTGQAQRPSLLPLPRELIWTKAAFVLTGAIRVRVNQAGAQPIADSITRFVQEISRVTVNPSVAPARGEKTIELLLEPDGTFHQKPEGYALTIMKTSVQVRAATLRGLFWGYQTLRQLYTQKPRPALVGCTIVDSPAFPIRGFMHDVGRSFIPLERLKQHITVLARYKINTFHWHLTEDLAWRLASDSIPNLTDSSVTHRLPGQFYTKQQARELAEFCRANHVLLIPELDMPGHSAAFKRATGYDMQSDEGKVLVKKLLREVCALFNEPYIHIGTDEVAFKDASFVPEMAAVVRACGKEVIGWYPGAALDGKAIRQLWIRNDQPLPPMRIIESRNLYFNHFATQADLISLFQRNLCDVPEATPDRLGAIGCV
ncbi:family 20 glycosylhydrolase [Spirosoma pomorum]